MMVDVMRKTQSTRDINAYFQRDNNNVDRVLQPKRAFIYQYFMFVFYVCLLF